MKWNLRTLVFASLIVSGAAWLSFDQSGASYEERLIHVAVEQSFGDAAPVVAAQPLEIQAVLLDYAQDEALLLQTRLALSKYPTLAQRLLPIYGAEPAFRKVLEDYGSAVLLPIAYFMDNKLTSLEWRRTLGEAVETVKTFLNRVFGSQPANDTSLKSPTTGVAESSAELTPEERGLAAIAFVDAEGYDFLGQFTLNKAEEVEWVQAERLLEGVTDVFFGGLINIERTWRQGQIIQLGDIAWAGFDVVAIAAGVKLLKVLRVSRVVPRGATSLGFSQRVALLGSRVLAASGRVGLAVAAYGAIPAAVYLMFRHPSLINATLDELAKWLKLPPWLVQLVFWVAVLGILGRLATFLLRPLAWLLSGLATWSVRLADWVAPRSASPAPAVAGGGSLPSARGG